MTGKEAGEGKPGRPERARKHDWIASQLRRVYDEALEEEIPEEMMALLSKLNGKEGNE